MELSTLLVYVILINLISHDHDVILMAYTYNFFDVLLGEDLTSGISRVDDNDASQFNVIAKSLLDLFFNIFNIESPILGFIKIVWNKSTAIKSD